MNTLQEAIKKRRAERKVSHYKEPVLNDTTIETLSNTIVKYRSTIQANEQYISELKERTIQLKQKCNDMELNYTSARLQIVDLNKQLIMAQEDFQKQLTMLSNDHNNQKLVIDQYQRLSELQKADIDARKDNLQFAELQAKEAQLAALEAEAETETDDKDKDNDIAKTKVKQKKRKKKVPSSSLGQKRSAKPSKTSKPSGWRM